MFEFFKISLGESSPKTAKEILEKIREGQLKANQMAKTATEIAQEEGKKIGRLTLGPSIDIYSSSRVQEAMQKAMEDATRDIDKAFSVPGRLLSSPFHVRRVLIRKMCEERSLFLYNSIKRAKTIGTPEPTLRPKKQPKRYLAQIVHQVLPDGNVYITRLLNFKDHMDIRRKFGAEISDGYLLSRPCMFLETPPSHAQNRAAKVRIVDSENSSITIAEGDVLTIAEFEKLMALMRICGHRLCSIVKHQHKKQHQAKLLRKNYLSQGFTKVEEI